MKPSMRPIYIPLSPCYTHGTISASLEGPSRARLGPAGQSPPRSRVADLPLSGWPISASLEGSGSTLERVANLRLPTDRRTKALKASHSTTAQRTGGGRLPHPQWM